MAEINRPVFKKPDQEDFFHRLRAEVQDKVLRDPRPQNRNIVKCVFLLLAYFAAYSGILVFGNATPMLFAFYILTGIFMMVLFINSYHDAVHASLFRQRWLNRRFTLILELFGSNSWLWQRRHLQLHHPFPNVPNWDIDIKQSKLVRIFPDSPMFELHRYQHIYMWMIYPFYSLNWLYIRDFRDFFSNDDNYVKRMGKIPKIEFVKLFMAKIINLLFLVGIPLLVLQQPWHIIILGWLSMHVAASVFGVVALISTHVDEHAQFPSVAPDGKMDNTWAGHQLLVTKDFSTGSPLANFLFGGFTHHVAHHLFPGVAHTYYPEITALIRKYADDYGFSYRSYPFHEAIISHFKLLKERGRHQSIFQSTEL